MFIVEVGENWVVKIEESCWCRVEEDVIRDENKHYNDGEESSDGATNYGIGKCLSSEANGKAERCNNAHPYA